MYRDGVELDFDLDSISALADKRQSQWSKIQNAAFLNRIHLHDKPPLTRASRERGLAPIFSPPT
jgi:hypothetical protein